MGQIDVSDILADPDFVGPLTHIKRKSTVNEFGQNTLCESGSPSHGCIQPATGKTLARLPEAFRVADVQSFWLKGVITADSRNKYPDILVKNGNRYTVQIVFDWSDWGQGWCEGTCVRERPTL